MEYSLDYQLAADPTGLLPIVDRVAPSNITKQVSVKNNIVTPPTV